MLPLWVGAGSYDSSYYSVDVFLPKLEDLRKEFGANKIVDSVYELPVLVALSHYPELKNTSIEFVQTSLYSTMMAQPHFRSIFKRGRRHYVIYINNCKECAGFVPTELSFNQLVGVLGHELGHICYYTGRNGFQILLDAYGYYYENYRRDFEAGTDMITVDHGLGWQLWDFTDFITNKATLSPRYEQKKKQYYLTAQAIHDELIHRQNALK